MNKYSKGISPLLASILLIALAVIIASMLLTWSTLLTSEQTQDITNTSRQITTCGVLSIEDVYLDFATNRSRVFVKSTLEDIIDGARLVARSGVDMPITTELPLEIDKGEIEILEFHLTANLSACVNFSQVIISTQCTTISYGQKPTNC